MERIAIFAALRWECGPVLRRMQQVRKQRLGPFVLWRGHTALREVWLMKTGIGTERAAAAANILREQGVFDLFLSTGCAGALAPDMLPGDLALATVLCDQAGDHFPVDPNFLAQGRSAAARAKSRVRVGPFFCSREVLATRAAKRLAAAGGAVAVDMESAAIAACAAEHGIPFASIRAILDSIETEIVDAGRFVAPESGSVKPLALAAYVAAHPGAVTRLLALQRMAGAARRTLESFFDALL